MEATYKKCVFEARSKNKRVLNRYSAQTYIHKFCDIYFIYKENLMQNFGQQFNIMLHLVEFSAQWELSVFETTWQIGASRFGADWLRGGIMANFARKRSRGVNYYSLVHLEELLLHINYWKRNLLYTPRTLRLTYVLLHIKFYGYRVMGSAATISS